MKISLLVLFLFSFSTFSLAQVGINTNDPKATLDVVGNAVDASSKDGIIAPRLTGDQLRAKNAIYGEDQTGAIVYATEADSAPAGKTINVTVKGYYYFDGSIWQRFKGEAGSGSESNINIYNADGALTGNRTVTQGNNTLKFTGNRVNSFNVGENNALSVNTLNNRLGINTITPQESLHVNGTMQLTNELNVGGNAATAGNPGSSGQVLVSNGSGVAPTWSSISDINENDSELSSQKIALIAILRNSISGTTNRAKDITYDNVRAVKKYISTSDNINFRINKSGYYNVSYYANSNVTNGGGTYVGSVEINGSDIFKWTNNVAGGVTNISDKTGGDVYLNEGDILNSNVSFTRSFTILRSSLSINYLGDFE